MNDDIINLQSKMKSFTLVNGNMKYNPTIVSFDKSVKI